MYNVSLVSNKFKTLYYNVGPKTYFLTINKTGLDFVTSPNIIFDIIYDECCICISLNEIVRTFQIPRVCKMFLNF